ncbi:MAG: patatin-like phospholipase family protein [Kofleriaceae bacterium]|nr:patatin-like phospholipase family protein [Kofleriaceae bacterium]
MTRGISQAGMLLGDWLAAEPFSLTMSSGFFAFFAHTGMLCALESAGLHPIGYSGSSAGALVGGLAAAGLSGDDLEESLASLRREEFWDPGLGAGLLRGELFRRKLETLLPVSEFVDCPRSVKLSVYNLLKRRTEVLTTGSLASAIHASCALPVLFQPVRRRGRLLSDGGIADRPGLAGMNSDERVLYHHISSRSAWRRRGSTSLKIPKRHNMVSLSIQGLTRANPFHLERGVLAMRQARLATERALAMPICDELVETNAAS